MAARQRPTLFCARTPSRCGTRVHPSLGAAPIPALENVFGALGGRIPAAAHRPPKPRG
jgi:hypothetical protein